MLIPDVQIHNFLKFFLDKIREDYIAHASDSPAYSKSILYSLFKVDDNGLEMKIEQMTFYKQAVEIFYTKDKESSKKIDCSIGYNLERQGLPHIHIMLANKTKGRFDAIGQSQGEFESEFDLDEQVEVNQLVRSFNASVLLMITGMSPMQVIVIQYLLEALLDVFLDQISLTGLLNLNFSTQDLQLYDQLAPREVFSRMILLNFDYQNQVSASIFRNMADTFNLNFCNNISEDNK